MADDIDEIKFSHEDASLWKNLSCVIAKHAPGGRKISGVEIWNADVEV